MTDSEHFHPFPESDADRLEAENFDPNQLNALGNRAIALGLIVGHGYHQGKYELLKRGEVLLFSPREALTYLEALIQSREQADG